MKCILTTVRTVEQGKGIELGKASDEYFQGVAVIYLSERDMAELGIEENAMVKVSTEHGSVVVRGVKGKLDQGVAFMPLGPWANALVSSETEGTGMPQAKGIETEVLRTREKPTTLDDLLGPAQPRKPRGRSYELSGERVVSNVVCPFCGCLCDDLEIKAENGRIKEALRSCAVSRVKFMRHAEDRAVPMVRGNGGLVKVSLEEALDRAAEILAGADFPLIYGLSSTEVDAQRLACRLAELTGAVLDNTASVCHGPTLLAAQACGVPGCSLGEVKNRADLIIFWGCNPGAAHLKHFARYSVAPRGLFREGKKDRTIIHIDVRTAETSRVADIFLKVQPNKDYELLSALRAAVKGYQVGDVAGVSASTIRELAEKMKECEFGIIYFGLGLTMSSGRHMNIDVALRLVRDLNEYTKFCIAPMRGHYNVAGANEVMLWTTGYPYAVSFARDYPVYNPGEFSAVDLLAREECDAALILASDPMAHFPASASGYLAKIPTIVIDPKFNLTSWIAEVLIPSALAGIECDGTAYRMDGVPIRLKKVIESDFLPDREILEKLIERIRA